MSYDVIIVGGGIVGCTAAFYMTRKGLKVALVERDRIGRGTTSNSFAWVNATAKVFNEAYHRLNAAGHNMYCDLMVEFGEDNLGAMPMGALGVVLKSDSAGYAAAREQARLLEAYDYPHAWVGREELRTMEPHIDFPEDAEAIYSMSDPYIDAPTFARFMAGQAAALGADIMEETEALELEATDEGVVTGLSTSKGPLSSPNVLVTVGPGTPEVLSALTGYDGFAARFPMRKVPGLLVTTPSTAPHRLVRSVVYMSGVVDFHAQTEMSGGLRLGADDTDGKIAEDQSPENLREQALELLRRTKRIIPGFVGEDCIDECRLGIGVRPYPEDGMSLVGRLPGSTGLHVVATHSGVSLAPILGTLMADAVISGELPERLKPFSLERFQAFV
ncbi:MAG: FAD-binding oxidoreductase [Pseudomonadota bacterium]